MRAVIFDLDGLLIDSEPLWRRAEVAVFGARGAPLTEAMCHQTTGLRMDEVVRYWQVRFPDADLPVAPVMEETYDALIGLVLAEGAALPGAVSAVERAARRGPPLALASSSPMRVIEAALTRLGLREHFAVLASAEEVPLGKPHPAVYLLAAERLGAEAPACLALEDSLNGLIAAKAARMSCVVVPDPAKRADPRWSLADRRLGSLLELDAGMLEALGRR